MDLDLIERLMRLLENSSVNELELTEDSARIRLSKTVAAGQQVGAANAAASSSGDRAAATSASASAAGSKHHLILAGLPGTFYRSPIPGDAPFVAIGDAVEDGRKLAIIEAMKMMNPVEADCAGRIVAIHLEDGAAVTQGMPLFTLETTA